MRKLVMLSPAPGYLPALEEKLPGWGIIHGLSTDEALIHVADAEIVYGWFHPGIDSAALAGAKNLKWMQVISAGVDNAPLEAFSRNNVLLTTASGVHANSISESILGMMLGFARGLFVNYRDQQAKIWRHGEKTPTEIHGKTIGIIGAGAIGAELARLAKAFNMRTIGLSRSGAPVPYIDEMSGMDELAKLMAESDYIVNLLPLTQETKGIIGKKEIAMMKNTAYYFSAGRGKTTDQDALIEALREDKIAGAGLDVTEPEPLPPESPLWEMENVFIGGHNSGGTDRYNERAMAIFMDNLDDYLAGRPLSRNLVDYELGY